MITAADHTRIAAYFFALLHGFVFRIADLIDQIFDLFKGFLEVTAFDFIDGKIVSYDEPIPGAAGPIGDKYFGATTEKIKTDKDIEYKIDFGGYESNDKESDNIGVEGIRIVNITENANLSPNASNKERDACCRYIGDYTN